VADDGLPSFSVVVPTFERPRQLADCLAALAALDYPRDRLEVIVVDDGGSAPLEPVVAALRPGLDPVLIRQTNAGPGAARNTGAWRAGGEMLAFTDDDCRVDPGWLRAFAGALAEAPGAMVGGHTVNAAAGIYPAMSQLILDVVYRYYNVDASHATFVASNNLALPAAGFRAIGGFDTSFRFSEDRDLCDRWRHVGRRIVHVAAARVEHVHRMGGRQFCRQHFDYGRGAERFSRIRAGRRSGRMLRDFGFHLDVGNWICYPLSQVPLRQVPAAAALLAVWQTTYLAGFLYEKLRRPRD
jgi:glycosyltransferase involved in cell wall biosynthesis